MTSNKPEHEILQVENRIDAWVKSFVVGLGLCPFAKHVLDSESVRYKVSIANSELNLLGDLESEFTLLLQNQELATSLLIIPFLLEDFDEYLVFLEFAQQLLDGLDLIGEFQLASFHPKYQFANTSESAPENYSNRSPFPIIHILRENQVKTAIETFGDTRAIPAKNISLLRDMEYEKLRELTE